MAVRVGASSGGSVPATRLPQAPQKAYPRSTWLPQCLQKT
jgi:hypothetical protein